MFSVFVCLCVCPCVCVWRGGAGGACVRSESEPAVCSGPTLSTCMSSASLLSPPFRFSQNFIRYFMSYSRGQYSARSAKNSSSSCANHPVITRLPSHRAFGESY